MVCPADDGGRGQSKASAEPRQSARAVLRIFRAELTRKFASIGTSAPFVVVEWTGPNGTKAEVARTKPHKRSGKKPVWNYEGQPLQLWSGSSRGSLEFQIYSESFGAWARGTPTFCGSVVVSLDTLLRDCEEPEEDVQNCKTQETKQTQGGSRARPGAVFDLQLRKNDQVTGTMMVQAVLLQSKASTPAISWREDPTASDHSNSSTAPGTPGEHHAAGSLSPAPSASCCSEKQPSLTESMLAAATGQLSVVGKEESSVYISHSSSAVTSVATGVTQSPTTVPTPGAARVLTPGAAASSGATSSRRPSIPLSSRNHRAASKVSSKASSTKSTKTRRSRQHDTDLTELTTVDAGRFQSPVHRVSVSGGTASFFHLALLEGDPLPRDYFIGKDLSRATDEVTFYEEALHLTNRIENGNEDSTGMAPLLKYMLQYEGVADCEVSPDAEGLDRAQLLVLRNLRDGCKCLRMLDVKIGERTADAGWQGKSAAGAFKQAILDGLTTSASEGFRVEGFDGAPQGFSSLDPLMDVNRLGLMLTNEKDLRKKAKRFMLQRMPASEIVMHLVDVHQELQEQPDGPPRWAPSELVEIALHEMCRQLVGLAVACRRTSVPQKWVGSSVALGFEVGECALRKVPEADLRKAVRVNIFDWGRSEFNTSEKHEALSEADRQDRADFWKYYVGGVDRLAWEVMRCYRHRFGCASTWRSVRIEVWDFDSLSDNDFIGQVVIPFNIPPEGEVTFTLEDQKGRPVRTFRGHPSTLTCKVSYRTFQKGSRLQGAWRITVIKATNLPGRDIMQGKATSDPFAVVTAVSTDGRFQFRQQTSTIARELNPEWYESVEVPVAADPAALHLAFTELAPGLGSAPLGTLLPPESVNESEVEKAVQAWVSRLDEAAANFATASVAASDRGSNRQSVHSDAGHEGPATARKDPQVPRLPLRDCSAQGTCDVADGPPLQVQQLPEPIAPGEPPPVPRWVTA